MANHLPKIGNVDFDWNDLKYALTVARHGGLTHAAKLLGTSASTVSRHIQQLETSLGQTLFLRQQSGYLLTDQGKEVLELIASVEQALLALERHQKPDSPTQSVSGLVRLACAEMMASHLIVPNLPKLYQAHPDLQVELAVDIRLADLNRREADLALRLVAPGGKVGEQDYIVHPLGKMPFATYVSKHHEVSNNYISWGQDWAHLPMVEWLAQQFKTQPAVLVSNSANAQIQAARHGIGIVMLPRYVGDVEPDLREIELSKTKLCRDIWLVYHRDLKASSRVQVMREFLSTSIQATLG
ncbi:LysR family transcriptional regulator [Solimicrobium silvestre]|nr:LysR family transcriptional regulator [Solimicrobium silvestre]